MAHPCYISSSYEDHIHKIQFLRERRKTMILDIVIGAVAVTTITAIITELFKKMGSLPAEERSHAFVSCTRIYLHKFREKT